MDSNEFEIEKAKVRAGKVRFWIGSVILGLVSLIATWLFNYYELQTQRIKHENDHLRDFIPYVTDKDPRIRREVAEFFEIMSPDTEANDRWKKYLKKVGMVVEQLEPLEAKSRKTQLDLKSINEEIEQLYVELSKETDEKRVRELTLAVQEKTKERARLEAKLQKVTSQIKQVDPTIELRGASPPSVVLSGVSLERLPWMVVAFDEMEKGVDEIRGSESNPRIIEYHQATSLKANSDEVPWNSSFVNWVMKKAGFKGTNSGLARSWLKWGLELEKPEPGCIAVFSRGNNPAFGHVGFYIKEMGDRIQLLGGNQSNQINISSYPKSRYLGCRWPSGISGSQQ